uniref:Tensin-3-like isoform X2 n=1 Tax=Petromyzon marinus TaxID=7757 RepID=A0AAJ7XEB9_PETMA|nr:tensin-3-like isoform X2 [Petromyzon marinus]
MPSAASTRSVKSRGGPCGTDDGDASTTHAFKTKTFKRPKPCLACRQDVCGQAHSCRACKLACHKKCLCKAPACRPALSNEQPSGSKRSIASISAPRSPSSASSRASSRAFSYSELAMLPGSGCADELDLTYVTERIISACFPTAQRDDDYGAALERTLGMLRHKHGDTCLILNLSEQNHDLSKMTRHVVSVSWPEDHAPPLEAVCRLCKSADAWLGAAPAHVLVLLCRGGRGKPGTVVAAYMHYSGVCASAEQALDTFAMRKFYEDKALPVSHPSQKRYVNYFGQLLAGVIKMNSAPLFLHHVLISGVSSYDANLDCCCLFIKVYQGMQLVCTSGVYDVQQGSTAQLCIGIQPALMLKGDILVKCYHKRFGSAGRDEVFRVQFHTGAVQGLPLCFAKHELDHANTDERFPQQGKVEFKLSTRPESSKDCVELPNGPGVRVRYGSSDPLVRWDSYESFVNAHRDSDVARGPLDGGLYASVRSTARSPHRRGPGPTTNNNNGAGAGTLSLGGGRPGAHQQHQQQQQHQQHHQQQQQHQQHQQNQQQQHQQHQQHQQQHQQHQQQHQQQQHARSRSADSGNSSASARTDHTDRVPPSPRRGDPAAMAGRAGRPGGGFGGVAGAGGRYTVPALVHVNGGAAGAPALRETDILDDEPGYSPAPATPDPRQASAKAHYYGYRPPAAHEARVSFQQQPSPPPPPEHYRHYQPLQQPQQLYQLEHYQLHQQQQQLQRQPSGHAAVPESWGWLPAGAGEASREWNAAPAGTDASVAQLNLLMLDLDPGFLMPAAGTHGGHGDHGDHGGHGDHGTHEGHGGHGDHGTHGGYGSTSGGGASPCGEYNAMLQGRLESGSSPLPTLRLRSHSAPGPRPMGPGLQTRVESMRRRAASVGPREDGEAEGGGAAGAHHDAACVPAPREEYGAPLGAHRGPSPYSHSPTQGYATGPPTPTFPVAPPTPYTQLRSHSRPLAYSPGEDSPIGSPPSLTGAGQLSSPAAFASHSSGSSSSLERGSSVHQQHHHQQPQLQQPPLRMATPSPDFSGYFAEGSVGFGDAFGTAQAYPSRARASPGPRLGDLTDGPPDGPRHRLGGHPGHHPAGPAGAGAWRGGPAGPGFGGPATPDSPRPCRRNVATNTPPSASPAPASPGGGGGGTVWRDGGPGGPVPRNGRASPEPRRVAGGAVAMAPPSPPRRSGPSPVPPMYTPTGGIGGYPGFETGAPSALSWEGAWAGRHGAASAGYDGAAAAPAGSPPSTGPSTPSGSFANVSTDYAGGGLPQHDTFKYSSGGSLSGDMSAKTRANVKFVQDTSKYWYKPEMSRDQAIAVLREREPGAFVVRDSHSFRGAYGLAMKVATAPPGVPQPNKTGDGTSELVRHFLIESCAKGVRLKGCPNEPVFGSLTALVYQHSITPLALPCKLAIPSHDPLDVALEPVAREPTASPPVVPSSVSELLRQGAACNVLFLGVVEMESLTGPLAVGKAVSETLTQSPAPTPTVVHFKVSDQGITLTDNQRRLFFRRHYPVSTVTFCDLDPQNRRWRRENGNNAAVFGFVARKQGSVSDNMCHLFAELDPEQPASAIVNFVSKVMIGSTR